MKTESEAFGDGVIRDKGDSHLFCERCGFCVTCKDCKCEKPL